MTSIQSIAVTLLSLSLSPLPFLHGQAIAAATAPGTSPGFHLPNSSGSLTYGISFSERASFGYEGEDVTYYSTNFSGNVGYLSQSRVHPFSLIYSGGYLIGTNGEDSAQYHNLALSQVLNLGKWSIVLGDNIAYLPESAAGGLSGILGVGDANLPPGQLPVYYDQDILNRNVTRITNTTSGSATRQLTGKTGATTSGSFSIDRYIGSNSGTGFDDNNLSVSESLNHRIDARTTAGVGYSYGRYSYLGQQIDTTSQTVSFRATHQLNRKMAASFSAGPQWISSNSPIVPSQLSYILDASLIYAGRDTSSSIAFTRGTTAGSGVVTGAITNALSGGVSHRFGPAWRGTANGSYIRSKSLATAPAYNLNVDEVIGSVQLNRSISRSFSAFVSYGAERQIDNGLAASNILFNGVSQTVGFGITFAPESIHVGHQ